MTPASAIPERRRVNGSEPAGRHPEVLDDTTLYWLTNSATSSARVFPAARKPVSEAQPPAGASLRKSIEPHLMVK
jgi:hypothetical protein